MTKDQSKTHRFNAIVIFYPFAILLISWVLNLFALGLKPPVIALPTLEIYNALMISAILLVINHAWLMTSTELVRIRYKMHATPEEWTSNGRHPKDVREEGFRELERRHNAHRNTTENTVYFIFLSVIIAFISPEALTAQVWIIGFAAARLGYTYSYLAGNDNARGLFMSLGLLALFGMTSYLLNCLII